MLSVLLALGATLNTMADIHGRQQWVAWAQNVKAKGGMSFPGGVKRTGDFQSCKRTCWGRKGTSNTHFLLEMYLGLADWGPRMENWRKRHRNHPNATFAGRCMSQSKVGGPLAENGSFPDAPCDLAPPGHNHTLCIHSIYID